MRHAAHPGGYSAKDYPRRAYSVRVDRRPDNHPTNGGASTRGQEQHPNRIGPTRPRRFAQGLSLILAADNPSRGPEDRRLPSWTGPRTCRCSREPGSPPRSAERRSSRTRGRDSRLWLAPGFGAALGPGPKLLGWALPDSLERFARVLGAQAPESLGRSPDLKGGVACKRPARERAPSGNRPSTTGREPPIAPGGGFTPARRPTRWSSPPTPGTGGGSPPFWPAIQGIGWGTGNRSS